MNLANILSIRETISIKDTPMIKPTYPDPPSSANNVTAEQLKKLSRTGISSLM